MRLRVWSVAAVALLLLAGTAPASGARHDPTPYPGGRWTPPPPTYGVVAERNVGVMMSDGVRLTADVYRPADAAGRPAPGEFPVLLTQTPYTGSIGIAGVASEGGPGAYFVERGYVYVSVDVRGTGRSLGNGEFMGPRDAEDGAELVAWAADLPGVNGTVGLHGCSYLGHTQLYTAAKLGPGSPVKAMIPACVSSDPYRDTYMENGIPAPAWEGAGLAAGTLLGPTVEAYMVPKYLDSQAGGDTAYDRTFWDDRDHLDDVGALVEAAIPTLLWNGWDDNGFGGLELWLALQNAHFGRPAHQPVRPGDRTTGRYQLLLGDWAHGGGLDDGIQLQWYDTWLKGLDTGLRRTGSALHVEDRTTGDWTNAGAYPFTGASTSFPIPPAAFRWGPAEDPGTSFDVDLPVLPDGATLAGPGGVALELTSSNSDAQLHVQLLDDAADGTAVPITHGGALASMRAVDEGRTWRDRTGAAVRPFLSLTGEDPIAPGVPVRIELALQPTLWTVEPGHHLRLHVASQPSSALCLQKMMAITTDAVGCRPRSVVLARLTGGAYAVRGGTVTLALAPRGSFPVTRSGVTPTSGGAVLPLDWGR